MGSSATRQEVLRQVLEHVRRTGDFSLPWNELPELATVFTDTEDVLITLHRRWYARFSARLDTLLECPPADLVGEVKRLWNELTAEDPTWHAMLDAYGDVPVIAAAERRQRELLTMAVGTEVTGIGLTTSGKAPSAVA